jgi:hypothetical protein
MAIKPLEKRIDQMTGVEQFATESELVPTSLPPPIDMPPAPEDLPEPVEVAGKREALIGILKGVSKEMGPAETQPAKRIEKKLEQKTQEEKVLEAPSGDQPEVKPPPGPQEAPKATAEQINALSGQQQVRVIGDKVIVEPVSQAEARRFLDIVEGSPTEGKPPRVRPNLDVIDSEDSIKRFLSGSVQYYKNYIDQQRRAGRTFDQIEAEAREISPGQALQMTLTRKPGDRPFTDAESMAVRFAQLDLAVETESAANAYLRTGTDEDLARFAMLMQIEGYSSAASLGNVADYGRGLAVNRIMISPDAGRSAAMRQIIEQAGIAPTGGQTIPEGAETIADVVRGASVPSESTDAERLLDALGGREKVRFAAQLYKSLPGTQQKQTFVRRMLSLGRAGLDSAAEIFQSAIVSGPQTHLFNFLGTPIHTSLMMSERYLAAMMRGDSVARDAVLHGVRVIPKYLNQALAAAWDAAKTEIPADMVSKFDQSRIATKAENFGVLPETTLGKTIDYLGIATRAPGFRVLTTVDEGYKALLRGMEMEMIAADASGKAFNSALDAGKSIEDATNAARDVFLRTIEADSTFAQASEFARIGTFQDELPGVFLGQAQSFFAHPLAKLLGFPFFKTPVQIALRIQERTPLAVIMPRFWKAMVNPSSEAERSVALAKVGFSSAVGSSIMLADYISGGNVTITGYGPTNPKERQNWLQTHEPYSVGIKKPDGSYTWVNYGRYDPISGIVAGWADVRDTALKLDDPDAQENLIFDMSLSTVNYMLENQPMVQFFSELASIIKPQSDEERLDTATQAERIVGAFQKQTVASGLVVAQSVGTFGLAPTGIVSNIERYVDPFKRSALPENQYEYLDLPGWRMSLRPVYEAVQAHRSRLPYFSSQLFVERNDWYEPIKQGFGDLTAFLPTRIQDKKYNAINRELDELRSGFPRISNTLGESMLKLNDQQFERYKELINYPTRSVFALEVLGYDRQEISAMPQNQRARLTKELEQQLPSLADGLIAVIADPYYKMTIDKDTGVERPASKGERLDKLTNARRRYTELAKKLMLTEFPELQQLIDQRKAYEDKTGRKPPSLPLSEGALRAIEEK